MEKKTKTKSDSSFVSVPVVSILGHVDHGKTTLLDTIRKSHVAEKEFGGITQHIGAYQIIVNLKNSKDAERILLRPRADQDDFLHERKITFIDTPGHQAFAKMRSRGANASDIAILVVSAADGVMPQTKESIAHIKKAGIPYIVAVTKIDLPGAQIEKVKKQLSKEGVEIDEYGGNVPVVGVSAKTGEGIDKLLDLIPFMAELNDIKKDPNAAFEGVVIEAKIDRGKGPVATVIVKSGKLEKGETIVTKDGIETRVRAMIDEYGKMVDLATVGKPVEILGLPALVDVGMSIYKKGETAIETTPINTIASAPDVRAGVPEIAPIVEISEQKLKIVLRADTAGSLEAIRGSLKDNVELISSGTGIITESDVILAKSSKAIVIGFNVKPTGSVVKLATSEKVMIKTYHIIYEMLDEIDEVVEALRTGGLEDELGKGRVLAQFEIKGEKVAGIKVISGRIAKGDKVKVLRGEKEIGRARIKSLRHKKEEITKAELGVEAGLTLSQKLDFLPDDDIIAIG